MDSPALVGGGIAPPRNFRYREDIAPADATTDTMVENLEAIEDRQLRLG